MEMEQKEQKGLGNPPSGHPFQFSCSTSLGILCLPCETAGGERALLLSPGWAMVWGGSQSSEGSQGARHVKSSVLMARNLVRGLKTVSSSIISWALWMTTIITEDGAGTGTCVPMRVNKWNGCHFGKAEKL